ncbi:hypothetical protein KIPB_012181, partial [Kipferlia bialata]
QRERERNKTGKLSRHPSLEEGREGEGEEEVEVEREREERDDEWQRHVAREVHRERATGYDGKGRAGGEGETLLSDLPLYDSVWEEGSEEEPRPLVSPRPHNRPSRHTDREIERGRERQGDSGDGVTALSFTTSTTDLLLGVTEGTDQDGHSTYPAHTDRSRVSKANTTSPGLSRDLSAIAFP